MVERREHLGPVAELDEQMCWSLLHAHSIGRLALQAGHRIDIFTVKYVLEGGRIVFQSMPGESFSSIVVSRQVAFEIDEARAGSVKSVIVYGAAQWYPYEVELSQEGREQVQLADPCVMNWVEVVPERVSGRELRVNVHR